MLDQPQMAVGLAEHTRLYGQIFWRISPVRYAKLVPAMIVEEETFAFQWIRRDVKKSCLSLQRNRGFATVGVCLIWGCGGRIIAPV